MTEVKINTTVINFPSTWNELSAKQLLFICERIQVWTIMKKLGKFIMQQRIFILMSFLNISSWNPFQKRRRLFWKIEKDAMPDLIKLTHFVFDENTLTQPKIKSFNHRFTTYYLPAQELKSFIMIEFATADYFYAMYQKTKKKVWLIKLTALMFRTRRDGYNPMKDDDARDIFYLNAYNSDETLSAIEKRFSTLSDKYLNLAWLYYMGVRKLLEKKFKHLFSNKAKKKAKQVGWGHAILDLAGNKFGDYSETCNSKMYDVLFFMNQLCKMENETK